MATAVPLPAAVELFYSYAHADEPLCKELQKHLTALKRSGLIRDWYDRKIEPGDEWSAQIHEAMERAGIILLLISADFLASKYIFEVELPFALERHDSGRARVIPILLRPVEWHDSPFAKLQMLPSEARAVTLWTNQDEAFSDIAGRLRELLYSERIHLIAPAKAADRAPGVTQERVLDAAIASSVVVSEPTDLVTLVRTSESGGLKAILRTDRTYSPTSDDVRSETFELDFPSDALGALLPATLELALESPDFDPPKQRKKIRVPPTGDSSVSVFMITPKRTGTLRLNLLAISEDVEIGSRALVTTSMSAPEAQPILSYAVTTLPLKAVSRGDQTRPAAQGPSEFTRVFGNVGSPPPPHAPGAPPQMEAPRPMPMPAAPAPKPRPAPSRSRRSTWIGIGSAAAAIALVCTAVTWNGTNTARPPIPLASPQPEPPSQVRTLNEAIKRQPNAPELYLQRAQEFQRAGQTEKALPDAKHATELAPNNIQAHLLYAQLLEKANLTEQALQQYKNVQALKPTPEVHKMVTQHVAELERRHSVPNR
ncbi:MAG TPA: TIR domain-containing protein [Bryobacteraceae bacterium]|nr:TIR domain-containing protein [Bryobacteraceae bacterium]